MHFFCLHTLTHFSPQITLQMSYSGDESEYEPSLRSLDTSDESASSSENDYSPSSEDIKEEVDGRVWCRHVLSDDRMLLPPPRFQFKGNPGITIDADPTDMSPFDFFSLFIDKRIIDCVVDETNRFAEQTGQCDSLWRPVTEAEILVFFAMKMLGGIVKMPEEEMNWSKDELLERPIFRKLMSLKRYSKIKQYLHFVDNETYDAETHPNPKLYKIYDVFMILCENFVKCYTPNQDLSIDESLMLFKGRLGWVQYIPLKRRRFGVKYFLLCEAKTGYVYKMIIYVGKGTQLDQDYNEYPVSSRIVLSLMKPLLGKGYCVTVDNYYTSPQLADALVRNQTDIYGTLRLNRKVPEQIKREKLKRGKKYYKKVFFHLMDIAAWNAYILYNEAANQAEQKPLSHLKFRMQIIRDIIANYGSDLPPKRSTGRPSTSPGSSRYTSGGHFPMEVPATEKKANPSRKCVLCSRKRDHRGKPVRKESRYMCKLCQVPLCVVPCFEKYHTK